MILTITLNAAVARTLVVPSLTLGHRHRAPESMTLAGGKGVNVARSLRTLDVPVLATSGLPPIFSPSTLTTTSPSPTPASRVGQFLT